MKCEGCGADVVAEAVYCQSCGARLDLQEGTASSVAQQQAGPVSADVWPVQDSPAAAETPRSPVEKVKDMMARPTATDDDVEAELWEGRYSPRDMVGAAALWGLISVLLVALVVWLLRGQPIAWGILLVVLLLLWGYHFVVLLYRRASVRYRLTSQRFFHEKGILRRVTDRIEVIDMDDIAFEQTLIGRLLGVGTITIISSDRSHPSLPVRGIEDVKRVAGMMDDARRKERLRRGLHIEAI